MVKGHSYQTEPEVRCFSIFTYYSCLTDETKIKMGVGGRSFTLKGVKPVTFWLQDLMEAVWLSGQHTGLTI